MGEFGHTTLKSKLSHSPNFKNFVQENTHLLMSDEIRQGKSKYQVANLEIKAKNVQRMGNIWFKACQGKIIGFQVHVLP